MNIELDLACVALSIAMHNQDAIDRFEKSRSPSFANEGWEALKEATNGKRSFARPRLRGISWSPCCIQQPGHQKYTTLSGGVQ